jgi:prophage DNA circulation protein
MKAIVSVVLMGLALVFVGCEKKHDASKEAKDKAVNVTPDADKAVEEVTDKAKEATEKTKAELEKVADKAKADADRLKADAEKANKLIDKVKHDL